MPTSPACSARAAARPRSCRCRGHARAAVSRCCSRHWVCPSIAIAQAAPGPNVLFIALLGWNVGINAGDPDTALAQARLFSTLLGAPIKDGNSSMFVGKCIELMKKPFRGANGHIAIGTLNVERAKWHLTQRGFAFDESSASYTPDGQIKAIYLQDEIAGFALHLLKI